MSNTDNDKKNLTGVTNSEDEKKLKEKVEEKKQKDDEDVFYPASNVQPYVRPPKDKRIKDHKYFSPFGHPFMSTSSFDQPGLQTYRTVDEYEIQDMSFRIRKTKEWWLKYKDHNFISQVLSLTEHSLRYPLFKFIFQELEWHEKLWNETGQKFQLASYDYIFYGDKVVSNDLKERLKAAAKCLEEPARLSKSTDVLLTGTVELISPYIYPLQYEITPVVADLKNDHVAMNLNYSGKLVPMKKFDIDDDTIKNDTMSVRRDTKFQLLPSIFKVSPDGKVSIESYINNLHPIRHKDLYGPIGDIFGAFVPAINSGLAQYASGEILRHNIHVFRHSSSHNSMFMEEYNSWGDMDMDMDMDMLEDRLERPNDPVFKMPETKPFSILNSKQKVIVRMANIELTPEEPKCDGKGGELGAINEDIVCNCIYFYDVENIAGGKVKFIAATRDPECSPDDYSTLEVVYGISSEKIGMEVGSLDIVEDRMISFPNIFKYDISSFELKDKTKPGSLKILYFFVCDPYNDNVISTDQVPPQQKSWWLEEIEKLGHNEKTRTRLNTLPTELMNAITDYVEWPMSLEEIKRKRLQMNFERSLYSGHLSCYERTFTMPRDIGHYTDPDDDDEDFDEDENLEDYGDLD